MQNSRRELTGVLSALALLLLVSLYRRLSMRWLPGDAARPYIVYAVYLVLILGWGTSIRGRITQRNMRLFLLCEAGTMLFWLSVRFVQDAYLYRDVYLMRISGYYISVTAAAVPLLGFYAAFGLGRGDSYRFSGKWYLLLLPAAALILLTVTNERHHFVFRALESEPQPNLYFHPNTGLYILCGWALALIIARVVVMYKRNRPSRDISPLHRAAPFLEIALLLTFSIPYVHSSFWVSRELVEFSAGVIFIEAFSWEVFICIGLIPVNTQYEKVFDLSTVAMQILSDGGEAIARSRCAPEMGADTIGALRRSRTISAPEGKKLRLYPLRSGYLVWQTDVSGLNAVIEQLRKTAAELEQESAILGQELKLRSEETAVREQNRIYNKLTGEVGGQLRLLGSLLQKMDAAGDREALFREICLIGTYVKRRCNLRLIEQAGGGISMEDLTLSFGDMAACLADMGVGTGVKCGVGEDPEPGFALLSLDVFEFLLEYERFRPEYAAAEFGPGPSFSAEIRSRSAREGAMPGRELRGMCRQAVCTAVPGGYVVTLDREAGREC